MGDWVVGGAGAAAAGLGDVAACMVAVVRCAARVGGAAGTAAADLSSMDVGEVEIYLASALERLAGAEGEAGKQIAALEAAKDSADAAAVAAPSLVSAWAGTPCQKKIF